MAKFKLLAENKNQVLLTKAAFGNKCQATYFHSIVGIPINPDETHHVALLGMESGDGVEVDPKTLFSTTTARHVPTLLQLMKIKSKEDLDSLTSPSSGTKKKVNSFAVLTPELAETCQGTNMDTSDIITAIVEQIKTSRIKFAGEESPVVEIQSDEEEERGQSDESDSEEEPERVPKKKSAKAAQSADNILKVVSAPYEEVLRFLWASYHLQDTINPPKWPAYKTSPLWNG